MNFLLKPSPMQRGFIAAGLKSDDPSLDTEQVLLRMSRSSLGCTEWERAWRAVARHHDVLRLRLAREEGSVGFECLKEPDFLFVEERFDSDSALEDWLCADQRRGFDIARPEERLWRVALLHCGDKSVLLLTIHHLLIDGRSFLPLLRDAKAAAEAIVAGDEPSFSEATSFLDYLKVADASPSDEARAWFDEVFEGWVPSSRLDLPGATGRPGGRRLAKRSLTPELHDRLRSGAEVLDATLNTLVQASWATILSRLLRTDDVVHGAIRHGRFWGTSTPEHDVGLFIVNLPVRSRISGSTTPRELLEALRLQHIGIRPHEQVGLQQLNQWYGAGRTGMFESYVVYDEGTWQQRTEDFFPGDPGLQFELRETTNLPIAVAAEAELGGPLHLMLDYEADRFPEATMANLLDALVRGMERMVDSPDEALAGFSLCPASESSQVAEPRAEPDVPPDLLAGFARSVAAHPDRPALELGSDDVISYAELDRRTTERAEQLISAGVRPGDVVGLCFDHRPDVFPALLAVFKAGAVVLPIDTRLGHADPKTLLTESGARWVWTDREYLENGGASILTTASLEARTPSALPAAPEDPGTAYVLFTSGSTGTPKAVAVPHSGVANYIETGIRRRGDGPQDRFSQTVSLGFDVSLEEVWSAWFAGACLVPCPARLHESPSELTAWVESARITVFDLSTGLWNSIRRAMESGMFMLSERVRAVIIGGEELRPVDYQSWERLTLGRDLILENYYGPTEASISVSAQTKHGPEFVDGSGRLPIGSPLPGVTIDVVDSEGALLPAGIVGELRISGIALGPGYLNRENGSEDSAFAVRETSRGRQWSYDTGDLGYLGANGLLYFVGRVDRETKIRGFRFHPGALEAALLEHPSVAEAVVNVDKGEGNVRVHAFVVVCGSGGELLDADQLRSHLDSQIPSHQHPHRIHVVEEIPLTGNGKVDFRALISQSGIGEDECGERRDPNREAGLPQSLIERAVLETAIEVLGVEALDMESRFHLEGGDSLRALEWLGLLQSRGLLVRPGLLRESMTLRDFSAEIERQRIEEGAASGMVSMRVSGKGIPVVLPAGLGGTLAHGGWTRLLDPRYDLYGVPGDDRDPGSDETFTSFARRQAEKIKAGLPEGSRPILVGICWSSFLVQEIAVSLREMGVEVGGFLMLEIYDRTPSMGMSMMKTIVEQIWLVTRRIFRRPWRETARHLRLVGEHLKEWRERRKQVDGLASEYARQLADEDMARARANTRLLAKHQFRSSLGIPSVAVTFGDPRYVTDPAKPLGPLEPLLDLVAHHHFHDYDHQALQSRGDEEPMAALVESCLEEILGLESTSSADRGSRPAEPPRPTGRALPPARRPSPSRPS